METQLSPDDSLYADAETIVRAGTRAAELTGQMLAFSRGRASIFTSSISTRC
jgi:hypothetical protein